MDDEERLVAGPDEGERTWQRIVHGARVRRCESVAQERGGRAVVRSVVRLREGVAAWYEYT